MNLYYLSFASKAGFLGAALVRASSAKSARMMGRKILDRRELLVLPIPEENEHEMKGFDLGTLYDENAVRAMMPQQKKIGELTSKERATFEANYEALGGLTDVRH